jgi:hypothetical protein
VAEGDQGLPLWFPLFFVALWLFVGAMLAYTSGWVALAARYRAGERPSGRVLRGQVIAVGSVSENNVTYLIPTEAGLYMYPMFLFRFMRPPILLPWREVVYDSSRRFLWMRSHKLQLADLTSIRMKEKGLRELLPFLPSLPGLAPE